MNEQEICKLFTAVILFSVWFHFGMFFCLTACFDRSSNSSIEEYPESSIQTIFRTVDSLDYSLIASIDVKHPIVQLAVDTRDLRLAVVENFHDNSDHLGQCRVYSIGQKKVMATFNMLVAFTCSE